MRMATVGLGLAVAFAMAGCGSDSTDGGNNGGGITSCKATVTGGTGVAGTYNCTAVGGFATGANLSSISISTAGAPNLAIAINITGQLTTGSHNAATSGTAGSAVISSGALSWINSNAGGSATGTFSSSLTSATTIATTANGSVYTVHGTYDGTFAASPGTTATGTVQVHVAF
jgi:hypothetical protein